MDYFENLAMGYLEFGQDIEQYNLLIMYAAALCIGMVKKVEHRMQRGTYFLNCALIIAAGSLSQVMWFLTASAIADNYLSVLVAADILVWIVSAYALIIVTKARSNDAYGHARYAALGFIPIANLWLLFTPSKDDFNVKLPALLTGGAAVILGLVISVGGRGFGIAIQQSIENYVANSTNYETSVKIGDRWMSYYISMGELEEAMLFLKESEGVGSKIDEITILQDIVIDGDTMEYQFRITDNSITGFTQEQRNTWENYVCDSYEVLINGGAMIIWHYYSNTQPILARIIGNSEVCSL